MPAATAAAAMQTADDVDGTAVVRQLHKRVTDTNIVVVKDALDGLDDAQHALLHRIARDDADELAWWHSALRPARCLVHPSTAFLHGIKALRPAAAFHTFDAAKAKLRRMAKQRGDARRARARRARQVAPTAALRAALNPHTVPRTGGHAPADEVRVLSRGQRRRGTPSSSSSQQQKATTSDSSSGGGGGGASRPAYYNKWRKTKLQKIGKGL